MATCVMCRKTFEGKASHLCPDCPPSSCTVESFVGRWCVHVIVCGIYTGAYKFDTEEQAQTDAADRRRKFGVLGCRYIVAPNDMISGNGGF